MSAPFAICPKCAHRRSPTESHIHPGVCPACGIACQKFVDRQAAALQDAPPLAIEFVPAPLERLKNRLLELPPQVDGMALGGRAGAWCAFALWTVYFALHGIDWEVIIGSFLHSVILPFHEFGHILFMPLGSFMTILGGSLFQVLMPLGIMAAFVFKQRNTFGASAALWWAGQSLVDLSPYIADAVQRILPLVGGAREESHDWGNLLTMTGMLGHAQGIARLCFGMGVLVMLAALAWGALLLRLQYASWQLAPGDAGD